MSNKFVLESDKGGQFFVCSWINQKDFTIIKVFYSALKAREYLHRITYYKRDK